MMRANRTETAEEKKERIFQAYKKRLIGDSDKNIRFIVIEYLCSFPKINPFEMAVSITKDRITVLFDDSSISKADNRAKESKVNKLLSV